MPPMPVWRGRVTEAGTYLERAVVAFDFMTLTLFDLLWAPYSTPLLLQAFPPTVEREDEGEGGTEDKHREREADSVNTIAEMKIYEDQRGNRPSSHESSHTNRRQKRKKKTEDD